MNIDKFEERAKEIVVENNLFVPTEGTTDEDSMFVVSIDSSYKGKTMSFTVLGTNLVAFGVIADNFDDLFDKALRVLKAYSPKATRERKPKEAEEATAQQ